MTKLDAQHYLNYAGTDFSGPSVTSDNNEGLDVAQMCILKWFLRTGFSMHHVQQLMAPQKFRNSNDTIRELPPVIKPGVSFKRIRDCQLPACQALRLTRARRQSPGVIKTKAVKDKAGILSCDSLSVGDFVLTNQFISKTPGRLGTGFGREASYNRYQGGTIYNDDFSGLLYVNNQVSLGASETIVGKIAYYSLKIVQQTVPQFFRGGFIRKVIECGAMSRAARPAPERGEGKKSVQRW